MKSSEELFLEYSSRKLEQLAERICACMDLLAPEQIWQRHSEADNAIGNLVLHLCGNLRQWIGSGVGGQPDIRTRELEFAAHYSVAREELKEKLTGTVKEAITTIRGLPANRLAEQTRIQGYELSVLEAIYHVVEHFSGHAGQVIFATKLLTGRDLGFYKHLGEARLHREKTP